MRKKQQDKGHVKSYDGQDRLFLTAWELTGKTGTPTRRQFRKFTKQRGLAFAQLDAAKASLNPQGVNQ